MLYLLNMQQPKYSALACTTRSQQSAGISKTEGRASIERASHLSSALSTRLKAGRLL